MAQEYLRGRSTSYELGPPGC